MKEFTPTKYKLKNVADGRIFNDEGWTLSDPEYAHPSLVRAVYENKRLNLRSDDYGFYRFADWLPINKVLEKSAPTITYKSEGLAKHLGLSSLYVSFSGYFPEKGAFMRTCSFKETEAYSVCGKLPEDNNKILVVASAGNTARAFAKVCSENNIPLLLSVPEDNINALWFDTPINDCVKLICTPKGSDYFDSIYLAAVASKSGKFINEGGAKNVARRDGMGTTVLSAATTIGRIPDSYFQAVGSGTGTIAAWEANLRLIEDGRFGNHKMVLHPAQNIPFTPMKDAWEAHSRSFMPVDHNAFKCDALAIKANVLSNRKPPFSIPGGVYDALLDSNGFVEAATNDDIDRVSAMFKELEGIDIAPAAAVAVQGMINAVNENRVKKDEVIMLNITGGGEELFKSQNKIHLLKPSLIMKHDDEEEKIIRKVEDLFK